ncbi:MAG TPA: hypothetical protein DHV36_10740, partial [Desulfobacteraceae bacterium]|nr:hypothetical protein [Desulfobacteraceae bacterium]
LILVAPLFIVLLPLVWYVNGWPVFYSGIRMGRDKKYFVMYKLRTLPVDFEKQYDAHLVSYRHGYTLPWFCRFMRDTRLDELPQLLNVLKGDMDFIGPRPVRPSVYKSICSEIRAYDKRFLVNPGLVGYSQLFTPHSTPKRIRSFIDNRASKYKKSLVFDVFIICLAGFGVIQKTIRMLCRFGYLFVMDKLLKRYSNKRGLDRIKQAKGEVFFCNSEQSYKDCFLSHGEPCGALVDINEKHMRVDTDIPIEDEGAITIRCRAMVKTKLAKRETKSFFCAVNVFMRYDVPQGKYKYTYILEYDPCSELNRYFVDQYFLKKSLMRYVI